MDSVGSQAPLLRKEQVVQGYQNMQRFGNAQVPGLTLRGLN